MGLLENLKEKLKLEYLSDLSFLNDLSALKAIIKAIPADRYSTTEWTDAVRYITKKADVQFETALEAREYILNY